MPPKPDHVMRAKAKAAHVQNQLDQLQNVQAALPQVGGVFFSDLTAQVEFQQWRLRLLQRAQSVAEPAVRNWLSSAMSVLTAEEMACIAGDLRGMRPEAMRAIVALELYQIALGEHAGQRGG